MCKKRFRSEVKNLIRFYIAENSLLIGFAVVAVLVSLLVYSGMPASKTSYTWAVAIENFYVGSDLGNRSMLRVKLNDGRLADVNVSSAGQVKVGEPICLSKNKTKLGAETLRIVPPGKCT